MNIEHPYDNEEVNDGHELDDNFVIDFEEIRHMCKYVSVTDDFHFGDGFSLIHLNARSLKNKFDTFQTLLANSGVEWSIICISETWLKPEVLEYFSLKNYELFASCRVTGEGGGTAIYVHNSLEVKQLCLPSSFYVENTWVEVEFKQTNRNVKIIIGCLYRPPNYSSSLFLEYMSSLLDSLQKGNKLVMLSGDFNYNMMNKYVDNNVSGFSNLLSSYGFIPTISKPTRMVSESPSLLDNIFINNHNYLAQSGIIEDDLSDHLPVFNLLSFRHTRNNEIEPKKMFRFS